MNIDILGDTNNDYLDLLAEYGYKSFVNIYTSIPLTGTNSSLDHIFIKTNNINSNNIVAGVIQTFITDHFSTFTAVPISSRPKYENTIIIKKKC